MSHDDMCAVTTQALASSVDQELLAHHPYKVLEDAHEASLSPEMFEAQLRLGYIAHKVQTL